MNQLDIFGEPTFRQPRRRPDMEARVRKSNGQFLAAKRAGKLWQVNALLELQRFIARVKANASGEFTFEEFRLHCAVVDLPEPVSVNAWGALPTAACKLGLCEWSGRFAAAVRPESHNRYIKVWRAV